MSPCSVPDLRRSSRTLLFVSGFADESVLRARPFSLEGCVRFPTKFGTVDESVLRARPSSFLARVRFCKWFRR